METSSKQVLWDNLKTAATIVFVLTFFVVLGWNLEIADDFEQARESLSTNYRTVGLADGLAQLIREHELNGDVLDVFRAGTSRFSAPPRWATKTSDPAGRWCLWWWRNPT